ncbi:MAG: SusC/RagA family TonB-linked outer membrane protein [Gemmatimonadetes bacterium]|nr:SusC/RagA family TonB-linked outer membrane protein [Gemmatimonadota bacterium]
MNRMRRLLMALAGVAALSVPLRAQQRAVGTLAVHVTDAVSQRPIEYARVMLVGTTIGGQTATDGRLTLRAIPVGEYTVRTLRVGYGEQTKRVTIATGQTASVDVAMKEVTLNLAAVVTTATGEQRRVEIGNATANIDAAKVLESAPIGNLSDILNSRAPGVQVTGGSQTGTGTRIRIRGTNSVSLSNEPIWIIDGIRMTSNLSSFSTVTGNGASGNTGGNNASRVGDLNPEDIESIEVVKGPSAATLYGTDAANGVVLVTTKRGRAGAAKWNVFAEGGLLTDRNYYPAAYSLWGKRPGETVSTRSFCSLQRVGTGECTADSSSTLNLFREKKLTPLGTGDRRKYGVQVSGGTEALRYFASAEKEGEVGVLELPEFEKQRMDSMGLKIHSWTLRPNTMDRQSLRLNLNTTINPKLDLGVSTNFINIAQRYSLESNSTAGLGSQVFGGPGTTNNGNVSGLGTPLMGYRAWTPGYSWQEKTGQEVNRFIWQANANWRPYTWLATRATVGNDWTGRTDENLLLRGEGPPLTANTRLGSRGISSVRIQNFTTDLGATAQYSWHSNFAFKTTVGAQYIAYTLTQAQTGATQLAPGSKSVGSGTAMVVGEGTTLQRTLGAFIEQSLAWNDRLFLTAAVRTDQNSAFGTNFQSIVYPKASMSWLLSSEPWWHAPAWVNSARFRYAYGQSGVQPGPNDALKFYTANTTSINNADQPTVTQAALGNPDLKPERSAEHEVGFETQLLNQRLSVDVTYYSKITTDALISAILPPSYGSVASQLRNLGSVKNAGWEASVTGQVMDRRQLAWDVTISGTANANKVVSLGDTPAQIGTTSRIVAGYPISGLWARPITGYKDKNGDGLLTYWADPAKNEVFVGDSVIFRGYATPRYMTTLTSAWELLNKSLRISTMWDYRGGNRWYNNTERIRCTRPNCSGRTNIDAKLIDQATNIAANEHPAKTLDGYFQPGAFVKLREMSVQYTLAPTLANKYARARSLNIVLTGRNLGLWTKYRGTDPESGFNTTEGTEAPNEFQTVGPPTYFILRVNLGY